MNPEMQQTMFGFSMPTGTAGGVGAEIALSPQPPLLGCAPPSGNGPGLPLPPGTAYCHCTVCGLTFRSETGFTEHRIGDYTQGRKPRCLTADELRARGWALNARGYWVTEAYTGPRRDGDEL